MSWFLSFFRFWRSGRGRLRGREVCHGRQDAGGRRGRKDRGRLPRRNRDYIAVLAVLITGHGRLIEAVFALLCLLSAFFMLFVNVNYDLTEYLPETVRSKEGLDRMEEVFGYPGTGRLMIEGVTLYEAKQYRDKIEAVDGVDTVLWCDSRVNIYAGEDFIREEDIEDYYRDGRAVMDLTFDEGDTADRTSEAIDEIREIVGDRGYLIGSAVQNKSLQENMKREMKLIMVVAVLLIFAILCVTTTSWSQPFLFLLVMGVAILINRGTNIFIGTISFLTNNVAMVLQLATSMDYSIFLLDAYERESAGCQDARTAMEAAVRAAVRSIFASSMTTVAGFLALIFMNFSIGFDLGLVLAKGIVISFLTVIFLMPAMIFRFEKLNERTKHRSFLPAFDGMAACIYRLRPLFLVLLALVLPFAYTAQGMNSFTYGNGALGAGEGTQVYEDTLAINETFGRSNLLLAFYPDNGNVAEKRMTDEIEDLPFVKSVTSLAGVLPAGIPEEFLPYSAVSSLHKKGFARMLIYIRTKAESDTAFDCAEQLEQIIWKYYPENSWLLGETPSTRDIRDTITEDNARVNLLSIAGVFLVVLFCFRSVLLPVLVIVPIKTAIFINMAVPYLAGDTLVYIGYIIVSSIQLGATVDYSILLANNYMNLRQRMEKREAAVRAVALSCTSIFTSGTIIILAGYSIYLLSSIAAIGDLGHLIGRGGFFSLLLVLTVLPSLLVLFDPLIAGGTKTLRVGQAPAGEKEGERG